jgi:carbonic anhydrase
VCGHHKCGGIAALHEGISSHSIADWLLIGSGAKEAVDRIAAAQALPRDAKLRPLVEENVRLQIRHLRNLSLIKPRRPPAMIPRIPGWVYCMDTGGTRVLVDGSAADIV